MTTYKIDYCNNFVLPVGAENLKEASQKAMEGAAYIQCDIKIRDESHNTVAASRWYGIPPEDWDKPC